MNTESIIKPNTIVDNCRLILKERCGTQRSYNHPCRFNNSNRHPSHIIPTNPIHSLYGVDNLQIPNECYQKPSYCNTFFDRSSTARSDGFICPPNYIEKYTLPIPPKLNRPKNHISYVPTPSESCLQMITNAIITKIGYKVSNDEIALLCCFLPSLIRQIMCKSPWLTPNDIIQCLTEDILKEAMVSFNQNIFRGENQFRNNEEENKSVDDISIKSSEDDNQDALSYQSISSKSSQESLSSQPSSELILDSPSNIHRKHRKKKKMKKTQEKKKKIKSRTPSTRSFSSQKSNDRRSNSHTSNTLSPLDRKTKYKPSDKFSSNHIEEKPKSISSRNEDSYLSVESIDSNEEFDEKSIEIIPKQEYENQSSRDWIEYPDKKDPNVVQDVEKSTELIPKQEHENQSLRDRIKDPNVLQDVEKNIEIMPKQGYENQSSRDRIEYPGKKDPNVVQDVEKCLAFYYKMREYFDDDVAAMLLKCCLCYGGCSGKP